MKTLSPLALTLLLGVVASLADPAAAQQPAAPATGPAATRPAGRAAVPRVGPVHPGFNPALPTLWLVGDSTVKNGADRGSDGLWGWGNPIAHHFDRTRINVENQALGGTSSRSFIETGLWENVRKQIKPGDFVALQFGHNDGRSSAKGNGDETESRPGRNGAAEQAHSYGWYVRQYIADAKAAGATPIVCSLIPRNDWAGDRVAPTAREYATWAEEAAKQGGALYLDLNRIIADRYNRMGRDAVAPFFPQEHTHTNWAGAVVNAECVVEGVRGLKDCPLAGFLVANPVVPKEPPFPQTVFPGRAGAARGTTVPAQPAVK